MEAWDKKGCKPLKIRVRQNNEMVNFSETFGQFFEDKIVCRLSPKGIRSSIYMFARLHGIDPDICLAFLSIEEIVKW